MNWLFKIKTNYNKETKSTKKMITIILRMKEL